MALRTTTLLAVALLIVGCENDPYAARETTSTSADRAAAKAAGLVTTGRG